MNKIAKDIFKAIYERKWLAIEYKNKSGHVTNYWIGIKKIDTTKQMLVVDGLNVATSELTELNLYYASIRDSNIVQGSYFNTNPNLIADIEEHPSRYTFIFQNIINLKLLDYYCACNRLDTTPYRKDYNLIDELDLDLIGSGDYHLSGTQFHQIVQSYNLKAKYKNDDKNKQTYSLCMNICSIHTKEGLYVLAYKKLLLDVKNRTLKQDDDITICSEFTINGNKMSIHYFLENDEIELLNDFEENSETIKDAITHNFPEYGGVDDMPYVMTIRYDCKVDLEKEYESIMEMYDTGNVTFPIKAFFGDLTAKPIRRKNYPLALYNNRVNLDQLLTIHNGLKYPVLYVQGPPGSGKTNTILNTVVTAFFNNKTVLISSYNNHPVDEIYNKLSLLKYGKAIMPFPVIRLGNEIYVKKAIERIRELYEQAKSMNVYDDALHKKHSSEQQRNQELNELLHKYERKLDLEERKEMIITLLSSSTNMPMMMNLQTKQLQEVNLLLSEIGEINDEDVKALIQTNHYALLTYMHYTSAKYIKHLSEPKYQELLDIVYMHDEKERYRAFNQYLSQDENMQKFVKVFPIVITTNISAHKLGEPKQYFDMVIMDEASQCNTAVALVPILRGNQLMLLGDPQQLRPVIVLDEKNNDILKKRYNITDEYDYRTKSVYQTFLTADAVSDEILLSYHYRCHPKIIEFNNKKYYNNKLKVKSEASNDTPLEFIECEGDVVGEKNTNESEAKEILHYVKKHPDKSIAVITPFVNQKVKIQSILNENGVTNVECGTVHAFQGDEKQEIIFSLGLSKRTGQKTYNWLKNNKELINVATSRAQEKLIITGNSDQIKRLHSPNEDDDIFELYNFVRSNGKTTVSPKTVKSRALGIKPYSTETEEAFLQNLNHAISAMLVTKTRYVVKKEVAISHVFQTTQAINDLFYTGRFDYVVYEKNGGAFYPVFAIELDGNEHYTDERVLLRDRKKQEICESHNFQLIRVPNTYARRYNYVKEILSEFFDKPI
ncbi:MAG: AAA domain-containing protein [Clostridia bacterium]|nr:AAA domain-containing protein [Clostridia bacterium]